jgi:hypothetical protein
MQSENRFTENRHKVVSMFFEPRLSTMNLMNRIGRRVLVLSACLLISNLALSDETTTKTPAETLDALGLRNNAPAETDKVMPDETREALGLPTKAPTETVKQKSTKASKKKPVATPTATAAPATDATANPVPPPSDDAQAADAASTSAEPKEAAGEYKSLDQDVQSVKKEVLDLNRELFSLEEELLFPANTQVAVFVSMDVGVFFGIDTLTLKMDNKEVANYLYTEREAQALLKGGVQRVYIGNLKVGKHELVAFFTGQGPQQRDYKRGATLNFEKGVGAKYLELKITDKQVKEQPEFVIKEWE